MIENTKNLPVARIDTASSPSLLNPEILTWKKVSKWGFNIKKDGRGFVWVDSKNPVCVLKDQEPCHLFGELRLAIACVDGRYGPVIIEAPEEGDVRRTSPLSIKE